VADVSQQLAILEEENTLLRSLGLSASLGAGKGADSAAYADALDDKDEAIAVLTQRARELEKKLEAVSSDLDNAMGQLAVTVLRARNLDAGHDGAVDPYVSVRVEKQQYKTQVSTECLECLFWRVGEALVVVVNTKWAKEVDTESSACLNAAGSR
jgi:hypothetical protein